MYLCKLTNAHTPYPVQPQPWSVCRLPLVYRIYMLGSCIQGDCNDHTYNYKII